MNWSSVKNLLILFLTAANIYLLVSIAIQDRQQSYIDEAELQDAASLLAERGLGVDLDGVGKRKFIADIYESFYPAEDDYQSAVSELLSGSARKHALMLLDGRVRIGAENGAVTEFSKDFGFSYLSNGNLDAPAYTDITTENFAEKTLFFDDIGSARLRRLSRTAIEFLTGEPSDDSELTAVVEDSAIDPSTGKSYILLSQKVESMPVFRHKVLVIFESDTITEASGRWYFGKIDANYDCEPVDQVNILFTDYNTLRAESESSGSESPLSAVTSLTPCYSIYMNSEKTALYLIPAWQINHENGEVIVYNAAQSTQYFRSSKN